jgi:hypothetical protein
MGAPEMSTSDGRDGEPYAELGAGLDGPLPNRFDRGTLIGCLGILCVLALPGLLFLPVEDWPLPPLIAQLVPLVGVAAAALGLWLLARVPGAEPAPRSSDPLHPLTRLGRPPLMERPASPANRLGCLAALGLTALAAAGYLIVGLAAQRTAILLGTLLATAAGGALVAFGALVAAGRLPAPAWRWARGPAQGSRAPQALPLVFAGLVSLLWALFVAASRGYFWAPLGVGAIILAGALTRPITRRLPPPNRPDTAPTPGRHE